VFGATDGDGKFYFFGVDLDKVVEVPGPKAEHFWVAVHKRSLSVQVAVAYPISSDIFEF